MPVQSQAPIRLRTSIHFSWLARRCLNGVDGPEATGVEGPAELEAASYLEKLIGSKPLDCTSNGDKTHGRAVVSCKLDGRDLGETIIRSGFARECLRYSLGLYHS